MLGFPENYSLYLYIPTEHINCFFLFWVIRPSPVINIRHIAILLSLIDNSGVQTLGVLDIDGLHKRVEDVLALLLVVTLAGDADTETEGNAFDTGFPDLLVELWVESHILGALLLQMTMVSDWRTDFWGITK